MNKSYEITQGVFSWVAFVALGVAFPFTLETWGIINALSYETYVAETAFWFSVVGLGAIAVKLVVGFKENKFFIKLNLANWFYSMSVKLDPRRK